MRRQIASGVNKILYEVNGWKKDFRINISGIKRSKNGETILMFDPSNAEPIIKMVDEDGSYRSVNLFSKYLIDHFGEECYQLRYSNRFSLMDVFKRWNLPRSKCKVEIVELCRENNVPLKLFLMIKK